MNAFCLVDPKQDNTIELGPWSEGRCFRADGSAQNLQMENIKLHKGNQIFCFHIFTYKNYTFCTSNFYRFNYLIKTQLFNY